MTVRNSGFVSQRHLLSGIDDISDDIHQQRSSIPHPHFPMVIVEDIIYDPVNLTNEEKEDLKTKVINPEVVDRIPRNSIIGSLITRGVNKSNNSSQIFFPFNQHDISPIKPGEQAFVIFPDPYRTTQIGFWLCRVPEPLDTDDINFTHSDRKFEFEEGLSTSEKAIGQLPSTPGFSDGNDFEDSWTTSSGDGYEKINKNSKANSVVVKEPVARFTQRPGDKVLQGSNGSRIVLGQDRTGQASETPIPGSPTIDIVVNVHDGLNPEIESVGTAPQVVLNSRNELEVDKNPKKRSKKDNVAEGDPDFLNDKSRLYITAKSNIDENFNISVGNPAISAPAIALKTDHIRLIANKDLKIIVGSTSILINSNGEIILTPGSLIKLGGETASLAVARETDPVMPDSNMIAWMTQVSSILTTLGAVVSLPPVVSPSDFGKIQKGGTSTKAT